MDKHKLFVGNMAARITQRDLWRFFSQYGLIDECAKFHESYAFVRFVYADDAQRARQQTHGAILKGRKLKVEFAATVNKTNSPSSSNHQRYLYIQPLRRNVNVSPCNCQSISTPKLSENALFPIESSKNDDFLTPDLLRLAGIQYSSPDDGYEMTLSPNLNTSSDSRFFPLSTTRSNTFSSDIFPNYIDHSNEDNPLLSWDFTRIRLFSNGSSGFGDDSNLYSE